MDVDIELHKPIDFLRLHNSFFAFEKIDVVNAGIFGCVAGHPLISSMLDSYDSETFLDVSGGHKVDPVPWRVTRILLQNGLKLDGKKQILKEGVTVYPINIMTLNLGDGECVAEHHYEYTWGDVEPELPYKYYITREYFIRDYMHRDDGVSAQATQTHASAYNIDVRQLIQETSVLIKNIHGIYTGLLAQSQYSQPSLSQQPLVPQRPRRLKRLIVNLAKTMFRPTRRILIKLRLKPLITSTWLYKRLRNRGIIDKLYMPVEKGR